MVDVFLCYAPADREVAEQIASRLDRGSEASVWLDPCGSDTQQTMADSWDGGMSSTAILLLLSPHSLPQALPIQKWQPLLKHLEGNTTPEVGAVFLDSCPFPKLLERKRFYRWSDGANEILRKIERWVIGLHRDGQPSSIPAALPWFRGREQELSTLWSALADDSSLVVLRNQAPRSGKSALAQEFARVAGAHFRDVVWLPCGERSPIALAGDLRKFLPHHRQLLVLDDVTDEVPGVACDQSRSSILITTRRLDLNLPSHAHVIELESTRPLEPLEPPSDPAEAGLLAAMSVCRPQAVSLEFAAKTAGLPEKEAQQIAARLATQRYIDPLENTNSCFRVIHEVAPQPALRYRHAHALYKTFVDWRKNSRLCKVILAEVEPAFDWALRSDWTLATRLSAHAFAFLRAEERLPEAVQMYTLLHDAAIERNDMETVKNCLDELAWISDHRGAPRSLYVTKDQMAFEFA